MNLPGAPFLHRRGSDLWLEDTAVADLAAAYGTPLYAYSRGAMRAALEPYRMALAGRPHLVCYAMKANSNLAVLQTFAALGCGFDIVSAGELRRVLAIGGDPARVVFSGVGKTRDEMRFALASGVRCFNVESESELHQLSDVARAERRRAPVSLRVNPDVDPKTHPYISTGLRGNKFGVAHDRAAALYRLAAELPGLEIAGIACHIGSQITDTAPYLEALDRLLDLVEAIDRDGLRLHHIDLGGGLGIRYREEETALDIGRWCAAVGRRLAGTGYAVVVEPGRSIVGNAGVLLTRVEYLKLDKDRRFAIVDASMSELIRPALYEAWHEIAPLAALDRPDAVYDVVGPVCESSDVLGTDRRLAIEAGDGLAILSAGAYGMAMASNYNSRPRPAEVMVDGARAAEVRARETIASLFAGESTLG